MRKAILLVAFIIAGKLLGQNAVNDFGDKFNFAIGLPKVTNVELPLLKNELAQIPQIIYSEYFYKDKVLVVECSHEAPLNYDALETILFKYFDHADVQRKYIVSFTELKASRQNTDVYTIK
jgi:hypothetical protein